MKTPVKDFLTVGGVLLLAYGTFHGLGSFPRNPFNEYDRPCAAFRTEEVRKMALETQDRILDDVYKAVFG